MRAVDTNVLVRLLMVDHVEQARAAAAYISGGVWVSHLVLAEAVWVLRTVYGHSPAQIGAAVRLLLDLDSLVIQDTDVVKSALEHFCSRPSNSFSDCLILEIARKAGHLPVGTLDKVFRHAPGRREVGELMRLRQSRRYLHGQRFQLFEVGHFAGVEF